MSDAFGVKLKAETAFWPCRSNEIDLINFFIALLNSPRSVL